MDERMKLTLKDMPRFPLSNTVVKLEFPDAMGTLRPLLKETMRKQDGQGQSSKSDGGV